MCVLSVSESGLRIHRALGVTAYGTGLGCRIEPGACVVWNTKPIEETFLWRAARGFSRGDAQKKVAGSSPDLSELWRPQASGLDDVHIFNNVSVAYVCTYWRAFVIRVRPALSFDQVALSLRRRAHVYNIFKKHVRR